MFQYHADTSGCLRQDLHDTRVQKWEPIKSTGLSSIQYNNWRTGVGTVVPRVNPVSLPVVLADIWIEVIDWLTEPVTLERKSAFVFFWLKAARRYHSLRGVGIGVDTKASIPKLFEFPQIDCLAVRPATRGCCHALANEERKPQGGE